MSSYSVQPGIFQLFSWKEGAEGDFVNASALDNLEINPGGLGLLILVE